MSGVQGHDLLPGADALGEIIIGIVLAGGVGFPGLMKGLQWLGEIRRSNASPGGNGHDRRAEARDFGVILERLAHLAEDNAESQRAAAQDREDIRDGMRSIMVHNDEQTKVLENLVKITDAALVASTANSKILQAFEAAGAVESIQLVRDASIKVRPRRR